MADLESTALDEKEIDARQGEAEPGGYTEAQEDFL